MGAVTSELRAIQMMEMLAMIASALKKTLCSMVVRADSM